MLYRSEISNIMKVGLFRLFHTYKGIIVCNRKSFKNRIDFKKSIAFTEASWSEKIEKEEISIYDL